MRNELIFFLSFFFLLASSCGLSLLLVLALFRGFFSRFRTKTALFPQLLLRPWVRSIGKYAKSENGFHLREIRPQGGFQLRNPNPDFLDFPFCRSIGKSEKGFAKLFS